MNLTHHLITWYLRRSGGSFYVAHRYREAGHYVALLSEEQYVRLHGPDAVLRSPLRVVPQDDWDV